MKNLELELTQDFLALFASVLYLYEGFTFEEFRAEQQTAYKRYYDRNLNDPKTYPSTLTISQWVNGQIISLT
jgi:hypothetical protein